MVKGKKSYICSIVTNIRTSWNLSETEERYVNISSKIYRTYKKVVHDIHNPGEYFYNPKRGNHILEFAENYCRHSKGKFGGKPVRLELWEKAQLATVFGFVDIEGNRKYRESVLIIGKKNGKSHFEKSVSIAGNLDLKKSKYLTRLKDLQTKFVLYGPNYNEQIAFSNITYKGSYSPEELPEHLNRGFGLIWDGESIDTCSGDYGNYLKYNNPHKLSLYIACGMPVFIWHEAAEASLVVDNNLGYTISNLNDIDSIFAKISEEEYSRLVNNVSVFSSKLVSGSNTKLALEKAMYKISRKK